MVKRVTFCIPIYGKLFDQTMNALAESVPLIRDAGWDIDTKIEVGCPYISSARSKLCREALDRESDAIVFIDQDVSWEPIDLLRLIETPGDVVCGTYRFKKDEIEYMGAPLPGLEGVPQIREVGACHDPWSSEFDAAIVGFSAPAGFMKITPNCVSRFMRSYPDLVYGEPYRPFIDLFNHGAHKGVWYGEDYAFCRNWRDCGGELLILPNLDITHWGSDGTPYLGNYHTYLAHQPGGALCEGD